MCRLLATWCAAAAFVSAQIHIEDLGAGVRSSNPPGIELSLRAMEDRVFHEGELLPIEVEFRQPVNSVGEPLPFVFQFAGVLLDPPPGCGDIPHPCWNNGVIASIDSDPLLNLDARAGPFSTYLNLYIPRLKPGKYRAALVAQELVLKPGPAWSTTYVYPYPKLYVVSKTIQFEIQPASLAWVRKSIEGSRAILGNPLAMASQDSLPRVKASLVLRFLQGLDAWQASLDYGVFQGLLNADDPKAVCRLMQSHLDDPLQLVSSAYLQTMAQVCDRVEFPQGPRFDQTTEEGKRRASAWVEKTNSFQTALLDRATAILAAGLDRRKSDVRDTAIRALIDHEMFLSNNQPAHPTHVWLPQLHSYLVRNFFNLGVQLQSSLLEGYWRFVRGSEMIAPLETILDRPSTDYPNLPMWRLAVQRLCDLDPAKGRDRLLAEILNPGSRVDEKTLALLPPRDVPPMDDRLIEALAQSQRPFNGGNYSTLMTIIARYATPQALPPIKSIFESQQDHCQPELMAYFLRVDPEYANQVFHSHPWDMLKPPPSCTTRYFEITSRIFMHPVLEEYMSAYLMHGIVRVKRTAAVALGKYGSKNTEAPLWNAFRYFHEYWKDHPRDLPRMGEGMMLENDLRNAIARSRNWVENEASLRMMQSLCITSQCQYETENDIRSWTPPLHIEISTGDNFRATVAQYGFNSVTDLENKLRQFPSGTQFRLRTWGPDRETIANELTTFAVASDIELVP